MIAEVLVLVILRELEVAEGCDTGLNDIKELLSPVAWPPFVKLIFCALKSGGMILQNIEMTGGRRRCRLLRIRFLHTFERSLIIGILLGFLANSIVM